jgi:uncharacterized cupin superfamily protein
MIRYTTRWLWILIVLVTTLGGPAVFAQDNETVGTLFVTEGSAELTSGEDTITVERNDRVEVRAGDQIAVSDDGEAILTFFTGAASRLNPGTQVEVTELDVEEVTTQVELTVLVGQTLNVIEKTLDGESRHEVITPGATITVRGTQFVVVVREDGLTQIATLDGLVAVSAQDQSTEIPCGYGLKVAPGEVPGELKVWGMARMTLNTPSDELVSLPVIFTNVENGQTFRYRTGDLITVPIGTFDAVLLAPGPLRLTGIVFPEDTVPEAVTSLSATFSSVAFEATNVPAGDNLIVRLTQDDLSGETVTAPGASVLVGPGTWQAEIALESAPDQVESVQFSVAEGEAITVPVAF